MNFERTSRRILCSAVLLLVTSTPALAFGGEGDRTAPPIWTEEAKLLASDGMPDDFFGSAVAFDGDTAIVAAIGDGLGSAHVFARTGFTWTLQQKLVPTDGGYGQDFGCAVAIDGDTVVVGRRNDDEVANSAGAVHVYTRSGTTWSQQAKLFASDANEYDWFGESVALDGDTLLVGTISQDLGSYAGSAFVFVRSGSTWTEEAKLAAWDAAAYDYFGGSVAIRGDVALVGAIGSDGPYGNEGAVYAFVRTGTSWNPEAKLLASDGDSGDGFGCSVSLDGGTALVGADEHDGAFSGTGAAYVFERLGTVWRQRARLVAEGLFEADHFGRSVSLEGDRAMIGAAAGWPSLSGAGSVYVFGRVGTAWSEEAELVAADTVPYDYLGCSVSLSGDSVLIGAYGDDDHGHTSGSAYVFSLLEPPGIGYCFGDPSSGTPCPCDNDNDGSVPGSGCDNGVYPSGAQLTASGIASVGNDSLVLSTTHQEPNNTGLYFQAQNDLSPGVTWGNGLRCAGGGELRLQVRMADVEGISYTTASIGAKGGIVPGDTLYYQLWYRTNFFPPCGVAVGEFNTTDGIIITWHP